MRKIKFRGKDIETGEWIYGHFFQRLGHYPAIVEPRPRDGKVMYYEIAVEDTTVGQFTGLIDNNGKEIYEGDILMFREECNDTLVVKWSKGSFVAEYTNRGEDGFRVCSNYFAVEPKLFRVVGNIHDNPEVLKGGEQ